MRAALPIRSACSCRRRSWRTTAPAGEAARKRTGDHFNHHARFEFNIPGITFGGRYDGSPIIVATAPRRRRTGPTSIEPTACPGGRAPHLWLADGRSLYDALRLRVHAAGAQRDRRPRRSAFAAIAESIGMDLRVVAPLEADALDDLYGAPLALIRPDQIVAWRGG